MKRHKSASASERSCSEFEQELLLYVHDALTPRSRRQVESHLRRCTACRQRVMRFITVSETLAGAVRGSHLPEWAPPRATPTVLRQRIPWYLPVLVFMLAGGVSLLYLQDDISNWIAARNIVPYHGFSEKVLTHNRTFGTIDPTKSECPTR